MRVMERYGREHYRRNGRLGGQMFALRHGDGRAVASRRRGGRTTKARYGHEHYRRIGRRGGEVIRQRYGQPFFRRLGQIVSERYGPAHYARLSAMSAATLSYLHGLPGARPPPGHSKAAPGRHAGRSRPALIAFERLERGARWATVEKLAAALLLEPADLLGAVEQPVGGNA
jgi:hypothetical protein